MKEVAFGACDGNVDSPLADREVDSGMARPAPLCLSRVSVRRVESSTERKGDRVNGGAAVEDDKEECHMSLFVSKGTGTSGAARSRNACDGLVRGGSWWGRGRYPEWVEACWNRNAFEASRVSPFSMHWPCLPPPLSASEAEKACGRSI